MGNDNSTRSRGGILKDAFHSSDLDIRITSDRADEHWQKVAAAYDVATRAQLAKDTEAFLADVEKRIGFMSAAERLSIDACEIPRILAILRDRQGKLEHARHALRGNAKIFAALHDENARLKDRIAKLDTKVTL